MPNYTITDPTSGKVVTLTGDSPPSEQELTDIFSKVNAGNIQTDLFGGGQPSGGASGSFNLSPQEALAPRQEALPADAGALQTGAAMSGDALSFVGRAIAASPELRNGWQAYLNSMGKTKSESDNPFVSFVENALRDPATVATLPFGGAAGKVAGIGVKALLKQIGKETLIGTEAGAASATTHQVENIAQGKPVDVGQAALETAMGAGLQTIAGGGGAVLSQITGKTGAATAKTIISNLTQIPEDVLERAANPAELKIIKNAMVETGGDLTKMSDDVLSLIGKVKVKAQDEMESGIMSARPGGPIAPTDATGYNAGESIANAAETAKQNTGDRFQAMQDITLDKSGAGQRPLPSTSSVPQKIGDTSPATGQNVLQDQVDQVFNEIGHDPAKGFTGLEKTGNRAVGQPAIDALEKAKDMFGNAKTTADALNMRRQIQKDIQFSGPNGGPLFQKGSDEDAVMQNLYGKINDVVENQIRAQGQDAGITEDLAGLWQANNASWKNSHEALQAIQDGLRIGKANTEDYFSKIKNIGVDDLKKISSLASTDPEIKPVWNEIQNGFFDNLVNKSLTDGNIDATAFRKGWNSMDTDLKATMLSRNQIKKVNYALADLSKYGFQTVTEIGSNVTGKTGTATVKNLENIGTKDKRDALAQLKFLEDIMGVPRRDKLSVKARDVYAGKQLKMTPEGNLPAMSGITTGKFMAGAGAGGAAGSAALGPLGVIPGMILGAYSQSPAGAVALYKAASKVSDIMQKQSIRTAAKTTGRVLTGPEARAGIRTSVFGTMPENKKKPNTLAESIQ